MRIHSRLVDVKVAAAFLAAYYSDPATAEPHYFRRCACHQKTQHACTTREPVMRRIVFVPHVCKIVRRGDLRTDRLRLASRALRGCKFTRTGGAVITHPGIDGRIYPTLYLVCRIPLTLVYPRVHKSTQLLLRPAASDSLFSHPQASSAVFRCITSFLPLTFFVPANPSSVHPSILSCALGLENWGCTRRGRAFPLLVIAGGPAHEHEHDDGGGAVS
ncbi:hypothetical protein DFH08DRAFT_877364 [Mycena albidolilacea]|uniref:Uncharacterized protein n=1 Tax=Mycena albidolilacea TaxID=1033008 RepID=A0AAD6ZRZ1_9AGAR|nr:hypothetical protein DFH08DRAFT_877364 [Mycena albidolilacea]